MLDWLYYILLLVILVAGWLLNILGVPGLWLMLIGHIAFAWATGWNSYVGWASVITLFVLALLAEIIEFAAGAAGSAQAGGTKRGMAGAVIGGLVGGIVGSILLPIPIVGTIAGAVGGSFAGAVLVEHMIEADSRRSLKIGWGAAKGRFWGIMIKSGFGVAMIIISLIAAFPLGGRAAAPPPTTTPLLPDSRPIPPTTDPAVDSARDSGIHAGRASLKQAADSLRKVAGDQAETAQQKGPTSIPKAFGFGFLSQWSGMRRT